MNRTKHNNDCCEMCNETIYSNTATNRSDFSDFSNFDQSEKSNKSENNQDEQTVILVKIISNLEERLNILETKTDD